MSRASASYRRALTAVVLSAAGALTAIVALTGARPAAKGPEQVKEEWLARLTGSHRQLFDAPAPPAAFRWCTSSILRYVQHCVRRLGQGDQRGRHVLWGHHVLRLERRGLGQVPLGGIP
jgi:hypothetical protein